MERISGKKIIFRADGNQLTGLGHLYRIFALIEMYKSAFDFVLLTRSDSTLEVIPKNYHYEAVPANVSLEDEPDWLLSNFSSKDYMLVLDGYHFNAAYQKKIKNLDYFLVYVDDLMSWHMYADIVINHSPEVYESDYKAEPYTKFALGTDYAILRPLFIETAKQERIINQINTVFVCFGGADPPDLTYKAVQALLQFKELLQINVVVGGAYKHKPVFDLSTIHPRIKIYKSLTEMQLLEVMKQSDFAIAPSSNILYELCAVKMPILSGYYVENQKNIYNGCLAKGCIYGGGNFELHTVNDFLHQIKEILNAGEYQHYLKAQSTLFNSGIKQRFLNLLLPLTYRNLQAEDLMLLYEWSNDALTRANSYSSAAIPLENHKQWFNKKLEDKNTFIYIAESNALPAGMVRYDISEDKAIVGLVVDKNFRGQGLAPLFLEDTARLYFSRSALPIHAYIKVENTASVRSFKKAGYLLAGEKIVSGCKSYLYKLEKL